MNQACEVRLRLTAQQSQQFILRHKTAIRHNVEYPVLVRFIPALMMSAPLITRMWGRGRCVLFFLVIIPPAQIIRLS